MMLKSLRMKNIRSYPSAFVEFPEGSTLLSGDIGTGKSTLLLAADFALFGIRRGDVQGTDLLRHGSDEGEIELEFVVGDDNYAVTRTLKRKKDSVTQESGFISVNGRRREFTPTEMTARIMELIGYPQGARNRPIFRYTVYTPQEEMKSIIQSDDRLGTLRKIFGIDKYGVIKSNASQLSSLVREEKRGLEGYARDMEAKRYQLSETKARREELLSNLQKQSAVIIQAENEILAKRNELERAKKDVERFLILKKDAERKESDAAALNRKIERNASEIGEIEGRISAKQSQLEKLSAVRKPDMGMEEIKALLESLEKERGRAGYEKSRAQAYVEGLRKIMERGVCDVCGQAVHNRDSFEAGIKASEELLARLESSEAGMSEKIASLRKKQFDVREYENAAERIAEGELYIREMESRRSRLSSENLSVEEEIKALEKEAERIREELADAGRYEALYRKTEKEYSDMYMLYVGEQKKKASLEAQLGETGAHIAKLEQELEEKEKAQQKSAMLGEILAWLDDCFDALVDSMERNVMLAIQKEFNEHFQKWFSLLMADALSVRINEDFAPVIEQNGYETEYRNLSGGEKTSVALAYRLALNKVVNNIMHSIQTKDLLILDEPTDGFSTDQLDRLRDVLEQLALKQVIIVSHEPKIDTYVNNVIRIYKEDHTSQIATL
ncbi:MAG: AAA family ATPase [Candidatus Aenigmarchaeota archaeon]|nr:AAA family ATPase [Candidatus Aenigmarchaeota archaeon]